MFRKRSRSLLFNALTASALALAVGCSGDDDDGDDGEPRDGGPAAQRDGGTERDGGEVVGTLYDRLGGEAGITTVIQDFVGRVVADPAINGYFLNDGVNGTRLALCLVKQVGAVSGGPQTYPAEGEGPDADGCRNMTDSHAGLGISTQDFTDLATHLVDALNDAGVAASDVDAVVTAISPLGDIIIEDADDNATIYQRVGRKPAIQTVIAGFIGDVVADARINGYFLNSRVDAARLSTCLVRQVCGLTGGPCAYGAGVEPELDRDGDGTAEPCVDMTSVHQGLGISSNDYMDLAGHLVTQLTDAGVAQADIDTIVAALTDPAFVNTIVEDPNSDNTIYQRAGRKPAVQLVIGDCVGRVVSNAAINGYFLNSSVDGARLTTCLVRQVCGLTGGPCVYGEGVEPELDRDGDGTADPCASMLAVHENLGISMNDYNDLAADLVGALTDAGVAQTDIDAIVSALTEPTFVSTIVEDANSNATIYQRAGRKPAVATVVNDFVGRVVADPRINGYFLNNSVDAARLTTCLVRQVCGLTGGPCIYGEGVETELDRGMDGTIEPCADMTSVHMGLGISQNDYNDLAGHLVGALTDAGVLQADIDAIVAALTDAPFVATVVEDPDSNATVYQRVGRKPAIDLVVADLVQRIVMDPTLVGFFGLADADRLSTCLVRQVCSIDGPCVYGAGVEPELMINGQVVECRDMLSSHMNATNPPGGAGAAITIADFNQLVGHLVDAMTQAGVTMADRTAIVNALAPLCPDIVADSASCN
ncbi:MAG: hypothetical protein RL846_01630 [Deltaproteobacteria bacterium]